MKKKRQAAPKKVEMQKKSKFGFYSIEQFVGFVFFIVVLGASIWVIHSIVKWMDNPERVVLSQLTVTGDRVFTTDEDIKQAILSLGLPDTFIAQDVDIIQQEVMRLPWIKQVSVRKQWPDKLILNVVEYQPQQYWNEVFLLDNNGIVFSLPLERTRDLVLPMLYGPEGQEATVLAKFHQLSELLKTLMASNQRDKLVLVITAISVNERYSWQVMIKECQNSPDLQINLACKDANNIKLVLGREKPAERFKRFIELFPEIQAETTAQEHIIAVDLRYNNGIAVQRAKNN